MKMTRRSILAVAAGGAALSLRHSSEQTFAQAAQPPPVRTRHNASSPPGKRMLAKYAKAVDIMKNKIPRGDPRHWEFQWYTHWVPGPQGPWSDVISRKQQAIEQVYAGRPPTDPLRALAQAMWQTCQVHGTDPADPNLFQLILFPPWHRLLIYHFEAIVRSVLKQEINDDDFTLPYWNYISDDVKDLSIPSEFRDRGSPLFVEDRIEQVNAGQRIDWDNPGEFNDSAFAEPVYIRPNGEDGFCGLLNLNPHKSIHTLVGKDTNMAGIPYAAKDPLFWVHHCEIDRLWESWNRLPYVRNPTWPDRSFVFADATGMPVVHQCKDADRVAPLNYRYDDYYVPKTAPDPAVVSFATTQRVAQLTRAAATAPVKLASDLVRVGLQPSPAVLPPASDMTPEQIKAAVFGLNPERQLYLVLGDASLSAPAIIRYNVYLELPAAAVPSGPSDPHYVGTFYFVQLESNGAHGSHDDHVQTFNVTQKVKALESRGLLTANPSVSLVPVDTPNAAAMPVLGRIILVES
jgi:tyrosinase